MSASHESTSSRTCDAVVAPGATTGSQPFAFSERAMHDEQCDLAQLGGGVLAYRRVVAEGVGGANNLGIDRPDRRPIPRCRVADHPEQGTRDTTTPRSHAKRMSALDGRKRELSVAAGFPRAAVDG